MENANEEIFSVISVSLHGWNHGHALCAAAAVAAKSEPVAQESAKQDAEDAKPSEDVENQDNDQRSEAAKQTEVVTDTQAAEQAESAEAQRTRQSRLHC